MTDDHSSGATGPRLMKVPTKRIELRFTNESDTSEGPEHFAIYPFFIADGWIAVGSVLPPVDEEYMTSAPASSLNEAVEDVFAQILAAQDLNASLADRPFPETGDPEE